MGFDLSKSVTSIIFTVVIMILLSMSFVGMGRSSGIEMEDSNFTDTFNNSITIANEMDQEVKSQGSGTDSQNQFFPSLPTIFKLWDLTKASLKDFTNMLDSFFYALGGGSAVVILKTAIIASIGLAIMWIIVAMLFKSQTKLN